MPQMASRQQECYVGISVTFVLATTALCLRLGARRLMGNRLAVDDYFCIVAFVFAALCSSFMLYWTWYGLGRFLRDVPRTPERIARDSLLYLWILEFGYAASLGFSKFSILSLYWRFFSLFKIRVPIIVLLCATTLWLLCRFFLGLFHCIPPQAFWDKSIEGAICPIDDTKYEFGTVVVHVALDLTIFCLPAFQLQQLHFRTVSEKLAAFAMFVSGAFVCIVSVVNLTQLYGFLGSGGSNEVLWNTAPPALWGTIEINMAIVAISIPLMRPIFTKVFRVCSATFFPTHHSSGARNAHDTPDDPPRWVHMEWLRKLTSIGSSSMSAAAAGPDEVELATAAAASPGTCPCPHCPGVHYQKPEPFRSPEKAVTRDNLVSLGPRMTSSDGAGSVWGIQSAVDGAGRDTRGGRAAASRTVPRRVGNRIIDPLTQAYMTV